MAVLTWRSFGGIAHANFFHSSWRCNPLCNGAILSVTTQSSVFITLATHSANSRALGMVADKNAKRALLGARTMLSSHTTPRSCKAFVYLYSFIYLFVQGQYSPFTQHHAPARSICSMCVYRSLSEAGEDVQNESCNSDVQTNLPTPHQALKINL